MTTMKTMTLTGLVAGALLVGTAASPAVAQVYSFGFSYGAPAYYAPAPVYYAPPPVYCPPPVYYPAPVCYPSYRVYTYGGGYRPYPVHYGRGVSFGFGYRGHGRHH